MSVLPPDFEDKTRAAVKHYWSTLKSQAKKQGATGSDRGNRRAVTGGKQMNGFCELVRWLVAANGMPDASIHVSGGLQIPGFFRPTKKWDLLVVHRGQLVAAVEFKSQVGPSFGNNFNNRTEEALGNATDIWTAVREGAFGRTAPPPWVGWVMFLEDCPRSASPVGVDEPHFKVFEEFRKSSYAKRYELLLHKLVVEKHYSAAALLLSNRRDGPRGDYSEPAKELSMRSFLASLGGHVQGVLARQ